MFKISDDNIDDWCKHIYKGELADISDRGYIDDFYHHCERKHYQYPNDINWENCLRCSVTRGSLLLDFNNFRPDKRVFLLHIAEYMEKPSLVAPVSYTHLRAHET